MPKDDFQSAPMIFTRFKDNFAEVDYTLPIEPDTDEGDKEDDGSE